MLVTTPSVYVNLRNDVDAQMIKDWRLALQRAFLTGERLRATDMPYLDQVFSTVENYPNMTIDYLQYSKIGKVVRRVALLAEIPRDDEFHFKDGAQSLVQKWQAIIQEAEQATHSNEVNANAAPVPNDAPQATAAEPAREVTAEKPEPAAESVHSNE
ncbi:hypothetical protein FRB90_012015 [Tulasnella sp. 427]|nr:hypothetical protein FRB90_012015 [Tulasnella sp. 427]